MDLDFEKYEKSISVRLEASRFWIVLSGVYFLDGFAKLSQNLDLSYKTDLNFLIISTDLDFGDFLRKLPSYKRIYAVVIQFRIFCCTIKIYFVRQPGAMKNFFFNVSKKMKLQS